MQSLMFSQHPIILGNNIYALSLGADLADESLFHFPVARNPEIIGSQSRSLSFRN